MSEDMWDREAPTFDDEPDHGLADPVTRAAWRDLLLGVLPPPPATVIDLGCGTGTLTRLLTDEGFSVEGLDFSTEMVARARAKVPQARFVVGDAADPAVERRSYDVVLSRHVLWAMPDPRAALTRWVDLLRPGGVLVLVEGRWSTGGGLTADQVERIVRSVRTDVEIHPLSEAVYWGKDVRDERYLILSRA